jgi:hypothetical protein
MSENVVFADFNNRDSDGYVRLNTVGTVADLQKLSITLRDGLHLIVSDGDLRAEIVVHAPSTEGLWRDQVLGPFDVDS